MSLIVDFDETKLVGRTMETVLLAAGAVSRFIIIKSNFYSDKGNAHYDKDSFVLLGEEGMFSTVVKIEAERATNDDRFVNLRFCASNKYWQKNANDDFIVAVSNKPEEDTSKSSCTLFEALKVDSDNELFYLIHVQSGGRLLLDSASMKFYIQLNPEANQGYLSFVNWDSLVNLPEHVAFKGFNGKYLQGVWAEGHPFLQFADDDPNKETTGYQITLLPDGHVRIFSNHFAKYWRRANNWIWADSTDASPNDQNTVFWPVKIDDNTIALRSLGNNNFCKNHSWDGFTNCLNAAVSTIENDTKIVVQELVMKRKLYNVRYRMEDSRIFNEKPFLAGTTTAYNYSDSEAGIEVEVSYEDSKSYSFTRSLSLSAGVTTTIEFGVPLISNASIEVSYEISTTLEWNDTTTSTTSVKATGSVPVPPKSMATVSYVGTMGTCDVPFSYTQQDTSSTSGTIIETEKIDGVFRGVNAYNFSFVIDKTEPLS